MGRAPAETARRSPRRRWTNAFGNLMLTVALAAALFAAYSLWWTDVLADRQADRAGDRLRQSWAAPGPSGAPSTVYTGQEVGFLHVPAMEQDPVVIKVGTEAAVLDQGVAGVYQEPRAAMPWDRAGNFALAAHRDGHGAKFHDLDAVGLGAPIVVETRDHWYVYRVDGVLPETSPENVGIVAAVPAGSPYHAPGRYITLTTCTPVYTSLYRMAVWGSLVRVDPMDAQRTPPAELHRDAPPSPPSSSSPSSSSSSASQEPQASPSSSVDAPSAPAASPSSQPGPSSPAAPDQGATPPAPAPAAAVKV
ncbi:class E sortase [Streptomyces sp. NRRL B-24484]|uniref:class E sortase n=1 Tax=Streptomyces sp. NRRL B-24484 TaxID=1463833 RepID=UPI0007C52B80|nr:class E sortase [Streptomyces sp. NRRL B-24484]